MVSSSNPPPSIYSMPDEFTANPFPENQSYVPMDDVYLALAKPTPVLPVYGSAIANPQPTELPTMTPTVGQPLTKCPPNWYFANGMCYPPPSSTPLEAPLSTGDCPSGFYALNGQCVSGNPPNPVIAVPTETNWGLYAVLGIITIVLVVVLLFRKK